MVGSPFLLGLALKRRVHDEVRRQVPGFPTVIGLIVERAGLTEPEDGA
ncbi:MAG TPA: hypothetical protein PKI03_27400 [Pseudomonadota bacterium]|nr:hypothetical protein [Pseudomonadota bacterium]